jgi:hypothetical protein
MIWERITASWAVAGGRFKPPKLEELYEKLYGNKFDEAHNAAADVNATARAFFEMVRIGVVPAETLKISEDQLAYFKVFTRIRSSLLILLSEDRLLIFIIRKSSRISEVLMKLILVNISTSTITVFSLH